MSAPTPLAKWHFAPGLDHGTGASFVLAGTVGDQHNVGLDVQTFAHKTNAGKHDSGDWEERNRELFTFRGSVDDEYLRASFDTRELITQWREEVGNQPAKWISEPIITVASGCHPNGAGMCHGGHCGESDDPADAFRGQRIMWGHPKDCDVIYRICYPDYVGLDGISADYDGGAELSVEVEHETYTSHCYESNGGQVNRCYLPMLGKKFKCFFLRISSHHTTWNWMGNFRLEAQAGDSTPRGATSDHDYSFAFTAGGSTKGSLDLRWRDHEITNGTSRLAGVGNASERHEEVNTDKLKYGWARHLALADAPWGLQPGSLDISRQEYDGHAIAVQGACACCAEKVVVSNTAVSVDDNDWLGSHTSYESDGQSAMDGTCLPLQSSGVRAFVLDRRANDNDETVRYSHDLEHYPKRADGDEDKLRVFRSAFAAEGDQVYDVRGRHNEAAGGTMERFDDKEWWNISGTTGK
eukprot:g7413.t1